MRHKVLGVIPARYKSTRFPGKPLVKLLGKPMIIWVAELSIKALGIKNVIVATEDQRIVDVVEEYGFRSILTPDSMLTGTDRVAYVASKIDADIYINIQGDEPTLDPEEIINVVEAKKANPNHVINCFTKLGPEEDVSNPNLPKVIINQNNSLVYMSRSPIPAFKDPNKRADYYYKQVCIYAFSGSELKRFLDKSEKGYLEECEDIEILRFLDLDIPIKMIGAKGGSYAVDVEEDVTLVESVLKLRNTKV